MSKKEFKLFIRIICIVCFIAFGNDVIAGEIYPADWNASYSFFSV